MKECWRCGNYQAYYTKGYSKFDREDKGICSCHKKIIEQHESCENWCSNSVSRKIRKTICLKALVEGLSNLSEIKQILSEEYEKLN